MDKETTKPNTNPYSEIFDNNDFRNSTGVAANQLLGFTVYYDVEENKMSREVLLYKISKLSPAPHSIFPDKDGYLLRFELDNPIDIEDEKREDNLRDCILRFIGENNVVTGRLQEMEIGRWVMESIQFDDDCEVIA